MKATYEPGMKVTYERATKRAIVAFRGRITVLTDAFDSEDKAIAAAEAHCRHLGWNPKDQETPSKRHFRSLF